jgi:nitrate reductase NapAB chaperone NapD
MPICSYLVIPEEGATDRVRADLAGIPECEVVRAENRDVLLLVTETPGLEEEHALRMAVEAMDGIQALLLTFGEIDPHTEIADPMAAGPRGGRSSATAERGPVWRGPDGVSAPDNR